MLMRADLLTPEQRAIVNAPLEGPFVVNAGAGTGKTYTLVRRAVRLVEDGLLRPDELLIVTFTNKAANEIAQRLATAFEEVGVYDVPICGTFHGIAASLLREFAYVTGDSPDVRAIDDPRARAIFRTAYDALLRGELDVDLAALPILDREEILVRDLATLAFSLKNAGISIATFERDARAAVPLLRTLPFGQLYTWGPKVHRQAVQPDPARTPADLDAEADREERNVRAVAALLRKFDALLAEEGVLTFGDLLTRAIAMLETHPEIASTLRRRWRHALVDELQDSNQQQLAFIRAIFGNALRPVMGVGDVRQAIYGWNGADPSGILRLAESPGTLVFPLTENRRSFQQILDTAHLFCDGRFSGEEPLGARNGLASHAAIRVGVFTEGADTETCRAMEAQTIASEIAALVAGGERRSDIAILLRSRFAARTYAAALRDLGIASRTHGGVGFFDAPEILDVIAWCRLAIVPDDRRALARILESPAVGLSDGSCARLFAKPADPSALLSEALPAWLEPVETRRLERFRATLVIVRGTLALPVAEAIRAIVRETAVDAAQIARHPTGAAQIAANVAKLVALAESFAHDRPLARLIDFVAEIDERAALEDDESEAELGGDEVSIMTIHAAKGLEWNHVFVANVSPQTFPNTGGGREVTVQRDSDTNALAFRYGVDGKKPFRWTLRDKHDPLTGQRIKEGPDHSEERRLLYVAITRAKSSVWISGVKPRSQESQFLAEIRHYAAGRESCRTFPEIDASSIPADGPDRMPSLDDERREDLGRLQARLVRTPSLFEPRPGKLSYTSVATFAKCPRLARYRYVLRMPDFRDVPDLAISDIDDPDAGPRAIDAATYGNIVHRALELAARETIADRNVDVAWVVDTALSEADGGADPELRARVVLAVERSLAALAPFRPIAAEEAFDTTIAGARIGGFIDLITRDATGNVWIVDYKTGRLPDEAYANQLALYRIAVAGAYPNARTAILRIGDDEVTLATPELPAVAVIERLVADAAPMNRDEPRPGDHCTTCPYAGPLCPEGAAFAGTAVRFP
jgi:DNA helicase-2/ATP-dependent DNA helicase PcrA